MAVALATVTPATRQSIRAVITSTINANFANTLGTVTDIVNIVMALCYTESSLNPNGAPGPNVGITQNIGKDYWTSTVIVAARATANPQQLANIGQGLNAWGLMQCGGWNLVKGASKAGAGRTEIEVSRPDLAPQLMVNAGESLSAKFHGDATVSNQILAGLVMLESKFKRVRGSGSAFQIGRFNFGLKIAAAVAGYIGLGSHDSLGTTPQAYSNKIVYGSSYTAANGPGSASKAAANNPNAVQTAGGPVTVGSPSTNLTPVGC
jgi:hypothetical protein